MTGILSQAANNSADPDRVRRVIGQLMNTGSGAALDGLTEKGAFILASVLAGSQSLGNALAARSDWLEVLDADRLQFPRRDQGLRNEVAAMAGPALEARDYAGLFTKLREFKQREMLRIGARDLARLGRVEELIREISDVADVVLDAVCRACWRQMEQRHGRAWHQDVNGAWHPTGFCMLGMGKLGGQELNYSSDVDVLFVYTEEGQVFRESPLDAKAQRPLMASHAFFNRLAEAVIAEVTRVTAAGSLFRIDLRLRPEGDTGPLTRSLSSYENYYAQWGQTWERMMLIKARLVGGDASLAAEFLEMLQPFRYPRSVGQTVLHEVGAMKARIETEVLGEDELERNVKLGRGGIREIEFVAQAQQLLHAGRQPFLQTPQTLPCLDKLAQYHLLTQQEASELREAYCFLRNVEHRLQMDENLQTHTIPTGTVPRRRLARLMGFDTAEAFEQARRVHTTAVRRVFDKRMHSERKVPDGNALPLDFRQSTERWKEILADHSFRDTDKALQVLREFIEGPGYMHVSPRTFELARELASRLFALCPVQAAQSPKTKVQSPAAVSPLSGVKLSDPDRVLTRLDSFIAAYGARAVLFELWHSNPTIFELLVVLFDRSEFLAELAIRTPDLVDELVTSGRLRQRKTAEETLRDLRHGLDDDDQHLWLRRYHQAEVMRIGLRDILGLAPFEQYLQELSALANACLRYALEVVMRRHRLKKPPFVVIGLGKLGGEEIDYGSDLDITFVTGTKSSGLDKLQRLALELTDLVSRRTSAGLLFHTDARLRPDGEKGLLVNTLDAYDEYYRRRAQLWEIQSLTRNRPVAGDIDLGRRFQALAASLTHFTEFAKEPATVTSKPRVRRGKAPPASSLPPVCATPDWKSRIHEMRMRIEKQRTPAGKDDLAIKTGRGGLMDAEFVAQVVCMQHGWVEPNTLRALERAREAGLLASADQLIENYRQLRRVEGILRRWSYEGETVLPDDAPAYYRVSVRCGFGSPNGFREALAEWRATIRDVYNRFFGVSTG